MRTFTLRRLKGSRANVLEEGRVVGKIDLVRSGEHAGKHRAEVLGQVAYNWTTDKALEDAVRLVDRMAAVRT